jgi:hypothetical protein
LRSLGGVGGEERGGVDPRSLLEFIFRSSRHQSLSSNAIWEMINPGFLENASFSAAMDPVAATFCLSHCTTCCLVRRVRHHSFVRATRLTFWKKMMLNAWLGRALHRFLQLNLSRSKGNPTMEPEASQIGDGLAFPLTPMKGLRGPMPRPPPGTPRRGRKRHRRRRCRRRCLCPCRGIARATP